MTENVEDPEFWRQKILMRLAKGGGQQIDQWLRTGQFYCNACLKPGVSWPELYHERSRGLALKTITAHLYACEDVEELKRQATVLEEYVNKHNRQQKAESN